MTDPTADKATFHVTMSKELLEDAKWNLWDELCKWRAMTPEERLSKVLENAKRDANDATEAYRPTCGDLLDMDVSLWAADGEHYLAAGTYLCSKSRDHDGDHRGMTLEGLAECRDDTADFWPLRVDEVLWDDDHPNRRANR